MTSRLIRVLLVVVAVALVVAAGYFLNTTDAKATRDRAAADALREQARMLASTLADIRTAQVAYVAGHSGSGL